MDPNQTFETVRNVIAETFNFPVKDIERDTIAEDVSGWDSLSHTILMIRLQNALGVMISEEIASEASNVGELADRLSALG
ncbi:acyl carrier protein [Caulobacter sp. BE254]|uniref:acyl carrier protein n=1 Tax=Caulobacter sp. BE254 TaxID=2817720 RepID=UPI0028631E6A|nr:acyl carrier protein [Caulobacter sp. BE254]MDR7117309.1 acyl carrier protein [Caulobacter sp. BE254]